MGGLAFADDVKMLCPTLSGLQLMYNICENYAEEYNIKFNGSKSSLPLFKGRQLKTSIKCLHINGVDKDSMVTDAKANILVCFLIYSCLILDIYSFLKV